MCGRMFSQIATGVRVAIIDEDLEIRGINLAALAFLGLMD